MNIKQLFQERWIITAIMLIMFWAGRLSWQWQVHHKLPPVQIIPEQNPGVPMVTVLDIQNGQLIAETNRPELRLVSGGEVAVPDKELQMNLSLEHLGFLGQRRPVIEHRVPEWALYVASKKGKYAYGIDQKSAKNLSVPNRVYFRDGGDAMAAGYELRDR